MPRSLAEDRRLIAALSDHHWKGVYLDGIEAPSDVEKASALLRVAAANRNWTTAPLPLLAVLDTAAAALALASFNRAIPGLAALLFDGDALALASGASRKSDLIADLRRRLPLAARASGAIAILVTDDAGTEQVAQAARDGYAGLCVRDRIEPD
ncbi:citrate lyase beta subunit [Rhizobium aquaticum]|uniref:Citrate lyase beta subunit n=1 Tax=Rhizobium aquaticum TaxID=1549636 RepID=A0ABV2IVS0_9HYPH